MRRIPRLVQSSDLRCSSATLSIVPFSSQCRTATALVSAPTTSSRTKAPISFSRFYSSKYELQPLPKSLTEPADEESLVDLPEDSEDLRAAFQPPPERTNAEPPTEVSDPSYEPAMTAKGLQTVGGYEGWWDLRENWPRSSDFEGFKARNKIQHPDSLEIAAKRALAEVLVLRATGKDLFDRLPVGGKEELLRALGMEVTVKGGNVSLAGNVKAVSDDLDWHVFEQRDVTSVTTMKPGEARAYMDSDQWSTSWKTVSLTDPKLKFAVLKRVFQLTGHLIPDNKLSEIDDVRSLLASLKKPPKPKTLSQDIQERKKELAELPNVAFSPKRVTRGDKDKALGRFKLIEKEFAKRDIDVHPLSVVSSKEKKWFNGEA